MSIAVLSQALMPFNINEFPPSDSQCPALTAPKPGEIWELRCDVQSPLSHLWQENQNLYSAPARLFLQGLPPSHYVMIVREPSPPPDSEAIWQIISVMVLSEETAFLSDVDLLIPSALSGLGKDLLAETWQVLPMLTCNLYQCAGQRLSRAIYDELLAVGDDSHDQISETARQLEVEALGLAIASPLTHLQANIQVFHQQERAWADVLSVPVAHYYTYLSALRQADTLLVNALRTERDLQAVVLMPVLREAPIHRISLGNWLQNLFEPEWVAVTELAKAGILHLAPIALRQREDFSETHINSEGVETNEKQLEIASLIQQLASEQEEQQWRRTVRQLGTLAKGNQEAIQAIADLVHVAQEDETLWIAVESLWQLDPSHAAAGVRRIKLIDWGIQAAHQPVALAVAIVQKADQRRGVMLRVYPTGDEPYLPAALILLLWDEMGQTYEVSVRRSDLYIQLKFSGYPGEPFSVQVSLGEVHITEHFVL